jgi:hypothetical protein
VDFTSKAKEITFKDKNGLYVTKDKHHIEYMNNYFKKREVSGDDGFFESMAMGYLFNSGLMGGALGGNYVGGMLGDMMNNSENIINPAEGGGGQFSGAGSGENYEVKNEGTPDNNHSLGRSSDGNQTDTLNVNTNVNDINDQSHNHNHDHGPSQNDYTGSTFS